MQQSQQQITSTNTAVILLALFLEKMSYYGVRSMIVLYMVSETFNLSDFTAISVYKYIFYFLMGTQIIGGVLGDFVLGHKKAILIGGLVAVLGCVNACFPNRYFLYIGLLLLTFGTGLLRPNMLALYGKTYYNKQKYLDTAFTFYYLVVNIGAFTGIMVFARLTTERGFIVGLGLAAILYIVTALLSLATSTIEEKPQNNTKSISVHHIMAVITVFFLSLIFWGLYELSGVRRNVLMADDNFLSQLYSHIPKEMMQHIDFIFIVPLLILFGIIWLKFYRSQFLKIAFGFLIGTLAFSYLAQIIGNNFEGISLYLVSSLFFWTVAEVLITPIMQSVITRYTTPRYLATVMGTFAVVSLGLVQVLNVKGELMYEKSELFVDIGLVVSASITIIIFFGLFFVKKYMKPSKR